MRTAPPVEPDTGLWDAVGRGDVTAAAELFHRHGAVAWAVARAVTGDDEVAQQAVVTAFVELSQRSASPSPLSPPSPPRSLRVEVLDASRRSARRLAPGSSHPNWRGRRTQDVYGSLPPHVGDVLALAVAGRCGGSEIAAIMGVDQARVWSDLLVALDHAAAVLDVRPPPGWTYDEDATLGGGP